MGAVREFSVAIVLLATTNESGQCCEVWYEDRTTVYLQIWLLCETVVLHEMNDKHAVKN
jgi:hypothetical protein